MNKFYLLHDSVTNTVVALNIAYVKTIRFYIDRSNCTASVKLYYGEKTGPVIWKLAVCSDLESALTQLKDTVKEM